LIGDRIVAPIKRADPLDSYGGDQIHTGGESPLVIPFDRDLA
jgi:hypothetical protein